MHAAAADPPRVEPEVEHLSAPPSPFAIRISTQLEQALDDAAHQAIRRGDVPGCVVAAGDEGGLVFLRAYGHKALDPAPESNDVETVYDLASVTKAVATTSAVLILVERGQLQLDAPVSTYLPEWGVAPERVVTLSRLLTHTSGLPSDDPLSRYEGESRADAIARIVRTPLMSRPGTEVRYSDLGFIVLGAVVERVTGERLDTFTARELWGPLGMSSTSFRPTDLQSA
jgi:CubicO group peptidase (beta-lactamase class C family)